MQIKIKYINNNSLLKFINKKGKVQIIKQGENIIFTHEEEFETIKEFLIKNNIEFQLEYPEEEVSISQNFTTIKTKEQIFMQEKIISLFKNKLTQIKNFIKKSLSKND